ncbi:hypothetical protein DDV98_10230 [Streptomyces sp. IB2014 011-12]|nr:hypothetical protein DDV98_10230 [Streptomyces sp. IB2014 011-12]
MGGTGGPAWWTPGPWGGWPGRPGGGPVVGPGSPGPPSGSVLGEDWVSAWRRPCSPGCAT